MRDTRGVRIAGGTPAARNCHGGRELTSGGAEAIRAERRPEVERGVLRWLPGAEAELMRRFAGAWGRWSGESAAAQCSALAERGEAAARVCGAARGCIGCRAAAVGAN